MLSTISTKLTKNRDIPMTHKVTNRKISMTNALLIVEQPENLITPLLSTRTEPNQFQLPGLVKMSQLWE